MCIFCAVIPLYRGDQQTIKDHLSRPALNRGEQKNQNLNRRIWSILDYYYFLFIFLLISKIHEPENRITNKTLNQKIHYIQWDTRYAIHAVTET